jgi:hypothetical protein
MSTTSNGDDVIPEFLRMLLDGSETPASEEDAETVSQDSGIGSLLSQPILAISEGEVASDTTSSSTTSNGVMEGLPAGTWDDPDLHLVQAQSLTGHAPPLDALPSRVSDLVQEIARALGAPLAFVVLALLVATAGVIGCARRIRITRGWVEPALLGGVLVGPPGSMKSPTCDLFVRALLAVEAHERQRHREHCRLLEAQRFVAAERDKLYRTEVRRALLAGAPPPPPPGIMAVDLRDPPAPALVATAGSVEGLRQRAAQSPTGLFLWRDEYARLHQDMKRFGTLRSHLLSALDGRAEAVDLVSRERLEAAHLSWTLLSTVQPDVLPVLAAADDGLWPRLLWAVADRSDMTPPNGSPLPEARLDRIFSKLRASLGAITWGQNLVSVEMTCDASAAKALIDARQRWEKQGTSECGAYASALAKGSGLAARIAHALAQIEWAQSPQSTALREISVGQVRGAITLMDAFFLPAARDVFSIGAPPAEEAAARDLVDVIVRRRLETFSPRDDIQRRVGGPLARSEVLADAIRRLQAAGLMQCETIPSGPVGGAPRTRVVVNPRLHEAAAAR